jgi:hypothetical protein
MDMINGYIRKSELVIEEFEKMVNNLGMRIEELPVDKDGPVKKTYTVIKCDTVIGSITVIYTSHTVRHYTTRYNTNHYEHEAIKVLWLGISDEGGYQGKGLGIALLFYGICKIFLINQTVKYIILDDDSDRPMSVSKNIYHKLGLVNEGLIDFEDIGDIDETLQIRLVKDADNAKIGSIEYFFDVAAYQKYSKMIEL